jgi:hypothetical protein
MYKQKESTQWRLNEGGESFFTFLHVIVYTGCVVSLVHKINSTGLLDIIFNPVSRFT